MEPLPDGFKLAKWWILREDGAIKCELCPRECVISKDGLPGACGVRVRIGGKFYLAVYGKTSGWALDPIEKKPLFHFYPGSCAFSVGSIGCNFFCRFCQNWVISQARIQPKNLRFPLSLEDLPPERIVELAKRNNCSVIAYTYNEPIVWYEYMLDTAKLARQRGLHNAMVTNGYINEDPLKELVEYLDAANVDLKGDKNFYSKLSGAPKAPEAVMRTIEILVENGVHTEITILIIPGWNDKEEFLRRIARWVMDNFGPEKVPVHVTRFYPNYMMRSTPPTPVRTIEKAREIFLSEGVKYVYVGNIPGHAGEHTYCPNCGRAVIKRDGFLITDWKLTEDNKCIFCGYKINIVGNYKPEDGWMRFHWFF
ncbi:MAG: AmmeMemoRadiSam system radical SAM enzyme [Candidatus Njordarchaeales archaeon]